MQHAQVHQQRNVVLSQQQSLSNKVGLLPDSEEELRRQQVQHLLSHQSSLNQSNQGNVQHVGPGINAEARGAKATRDRAASKKGANSSVLVVPSRDLQSDVMKHQKKYNDPNLQFVHNTAHTQMDSSQISMISRAGHDGVMKESLAVAQLAAYHTSAAHADPTQAHNSFHDTSVMSGPTDSIGGNQSYNTALIVKQRGLNNMSQIVATSSQLSAAQTQAISKYKNANILQGFSS